MSIVSDSCPGHTVVQPRSRQEASRRTGYDACTPNVSFLQPTSDDVYVCSYGVNEYDRLFGHKLRHSGLIKFSLNPRLKRALGRPSMR